MKIVILDGDLTNPGDISWEPVEKWGELTVYPDTSREERASRIGDAQAVIINRAEIDEEIFRQCPQLRYVGTLGTGYNYIDLKAAKKYGVTVCNVPGYSTYAVAQGTIALLLHHTNKVAQLNDYVKAGNWRNLMDKNITSTPLTELYGKTMGIVGMGAIGYRVAQIAMALGMKVLAYRRTPKPEWEGENLRFTDLDALLAHSDVVSLHCPLNGETAGMMDAAAFAKMKKGAILLNAARGGLVREEALFQALEEGRISYAGVDVLAEEPPRSDNLLVGHPCCTITPHVAWMPKETRIRLVEIVGENLGAFLAGSPQNVVGE